MSNQHQLTPEGVLATTGYAAFVKGLFNRSGDIGKDFAHAILGLATETHELRRATDHTNTIEELGDLGFYAQAVLNLAEEVVGRTITDEEANGLAIGRADEMFEYMHGQPVTPWDVISDELNEVLDMAKRWIGYGKPQDALKIVERVGGLLFFMNGTLAIAPGDWQKAELANVAKLLDRYAGLTFNADRAIQRDLASERQVLEQHAA